MLSAINLQLNLGAAIPSPAPGYITEKLQSVQVTQADSGPAGFQLAFHADRTKGLSQDYELLSSPLLKPSTRVLITVSLGSKTIILMDGFITRQELGHSRDFGASTLTVTGEDVSVLMDLIELSLEYPEMGDGAIAMLVLSKYGAIGVESEVTPTPTDLAPEQLDRTPQQNATDRNYLNQLASTYGYVFFVRPGPVSLVNKAYFGPPPRIGIPRKPMTVGTGPAANVESVNFQFDSLAPTLVDGFVQDTLTEEDLPLSTFASTRLPPLATRPALDFAKLFARRQLFNDPRYGIAKALVAAQAVTDKSTDRVVVASGELETLRYGDILGAPGLVDVRGAGQSYDGEYYVQSVTHNIRRGGYKQSFTLTREGVGSTITRVQP